MNIKRKKELNELHWLAIIFFGYPFFVGYEWLHWEIFGKGPRRKKA